MLSITLKKTKRNKTNWQTQCIFRQIMLSSEDTIDWRRLKQWIVEMMVMALGETCWNNEEGYHWVVSQTKKEFL
jgi:hypothetical protein